MGLAVERLPLTLHWKKLYISGRSNDNDNLLGIDYGSSHIVALQRSSERRPLVQVESRSKLVWSLPRRSPMTGVAKNKARRRTVPAVSSPYLEKIEPPPAVSIQQKSPGLAEAIIVTYRRGGMSCVVYLAICFLIHWLKSFWSMPISFLRKAKKSSTVGFVLNARFNAS